MVCRIVHSAHGHHGDWKENVYWRDVGVFLAFLAAASSATSQRPGAAVAIKYAMVLTTLLWCPIPTSFLNATEFVSSHPGVYDLDVLDWLVLSLQARPPTTGLESLDRADVGLSSSELVCRQGHAGCEHPPTLHNGMREGRQGPDREGVLQTDTRVTRIASPSNLSPHPHDAIGSASNQSPLWEAEAARNCAFWKASSFDSSTSCLTWVIPDVSQNDCL